MSTKGKGRLGLEAYERGELYCFGLNSLVTFMEPLPTLDLGFECKI